MHDKAAIRGAYSRGQTQTASFQGTEREYRRFWRSMRKTLRAPLTAAIIENMAVVQERFPAAPKRLRGYPLPHIEPGLRRDVVALRR